MVQRGRASTPVLQRPVSRRGVLRIAIGGMGVLSVSHLAACGGGHTAGRNDGIVQITERNTFSPDHVTIIRGNKVYFQNESHRVQTVTCDPSKAPDSQLPPNAEPFDSGPLEPWAQFDYTFEVPGDYVYVSTAPEGSQTVGRITVTR